ncbi:unnamed protein product [Mytilus coruscus]|uniref:Endonuclease/exonuclease/phosphatase domain-containing protein n=1 Tax=Mytilus coruscus TaxID=42192 RepID=A0A6J8A1B8_MYTCO|nr:unnamed protein product [Mytilus coruscus]
MSSLKLLAWNVRGIMSSTVCLSNLLRSTDCDVCIISEHKLKTRSLNYLSSIEQGYKCVCKADSLPNFYNAYHGKGGIAILYKSTLQFSINEIHDTNSERIVGLEIKTPSKGSIFIFGAYLPSDESVDNYRTELNILDTLYTHYSNYGNVIIAGDLNASCLEKDKLCSNRYKSAELMKFVKRYQLLFSGGKIKHKGPDYTFINKTSMIDYILMNDSIYRQLKSYEILSEGSVSSTSDHLPVLAEIVLQHNPHQILNSFSKLPAWHKITDDQIELYKQFLHEPLQILMKKMDSDNADIDTIYNDMVTILHFAADKTVPKCGFNPFTKPYWTSGVKIAHEKERSLRKAWVIDGRPRGMHHDSYRLYKRAKHEFRNIQQAAYEQYIQQTNDDINKAAECDIRLFWKLIKRNKTVSSKIYPEIIQDDNICNTPKSIANAFMDYFSKLYQPDSDEVYDNDTKQQIELDYNKILKSCYEQNVYLPGGIIQESEVDDIKLLKRRKASGHDKIQHEHLLYGRNTLVRYLTSLFNLVDFLQMQDHHMSNYKNILEQYTRLADGPDNSVVRVYVRPNTQIVYRNERNGRLNSESFGDQRLPRNRWPSHDDTDSFIKNHDHNIIKKKKGTERRENTIQTFVSEMEKNFKKSSKSIFSRAKDLFSDQTTEKRVYGIKDFVYDFLKIVSN